MRSLYYEVRVRVLVNVDDDVCAGAILKQLDFSGVNTDHLDGDVVEVDYIDAELLCSHGTPRVSECKGCMRVHREETAKAKAAEDFALAMMYCAGSVKKPSRRTKRFVDEVTDPGILLAQKISEDDELDARSLLREALKGTPAEE